MRSVLHSAAVIVCLAGCNEIFGLAPTGVANDADHDGVIDSIDNCPDIANPDQLDTDADSFGDACDSCPDSKPIGDADRDHIDDACDSCIFGNNHDEDADGFADACDNCPGIANDQQDSDGDEVGDACDDAASTQRISYFDSFAPPDGHWVADPGWTTTPDHDAIVLANGDPNGPIYDNPTVSIAAPTWHVDAGIELPAALPAGRIGIEVVGRISGSIRCSLVCTGGACGLTEEVPGTITPSTATISVGRSVRLTMVWTSDPQGVPIGVGCRVDGNAIATDINGTLLSPDLFTPRLTATTVAPIRFFDVIE